jgi:hypothetical protein
MMGAGIQETQVAHAHLVRQNGTVDQRALARLMRLSTLGEPLVDYLCWLTEKLNLEAGFTSGRSEVC